MPSTFNPPYLYISQDAAPNGIVIQTPLSPPVTNTLPLPEYGVLTLSKDATKAYVAGEKVTAIDLSTNTVVQTFPLNVTRVFETNNGDQLVGVDSTGAVHSYNVSTGTSQTAQLGLPAPTATEISPDKAYLYVGHATDTVSIINLQSMTLTATLPVPGQVDSIAANPILNKVYVAANVLQVIDAQTHQITKAIDLPRPALLAVNPQGTRIYNLNVVEPLPPLTVRPYGVLTAVDATNETIIGQLTQTGLPGLVRDSSGNPIYDNTINATSTAVYAVTSGSDLLFKISAGNVTVTPTGRNYGQIVPLGDSGEGLALYTVRHPRGKGSGCYLDRVNLSAISPGEALTSINVGRLPLNMTTSADGSTLFVANFFSGTVYIINTQVHQATESVLVPIGPGDGGPGVMALGLDGETLYIADYGRNTVVTLDIETFEVKTLPVGKGPFAVCADTSGLYMFVANSVDNSLTVISQQDQAVIATYPFTELSVPVTLAMTGSEKQYLAVGNANNTVTFFNSQVPLTVAYNISTPGKPAVISSSPAGDVLYVATQNPCALSIMDTQSRTYRRPIYLSVDGTDMPRGISITPSQRQVFVSNSGSNPGVYLFDVDSSTLYTYFSIAAPLALSVLPS